MPPAKECAVRNSVLVALRRKCKNFRSVPPQAAVLALLCAGLTIFAGTSLAQQGSFVFAGSLNTARIQHTATLLNNGKVLVAGGLDANGNPLASAELFDPATGIFTPTGSLNTARTQHTATLLQNGTVLVAGGNSSATGYLTSAELYDPTTGTFTLTGNLITGHSQYTATLLNNGMVLIAGGFGPSGEEATAELYDPGTGTFALTGSLNTALSGHTATLLNNGTVLIAGGSVENVGPIASAELFDPTTGTFTATGSLNTARYVHTATLLGNGTVIVAGGVGGTADSYLASAELYDPTTETFTLTGSLNTARAGHTAILLNDGMVLLAGGQGANTTNSLASAELYDPAAGTFAFTGSLNTGRQTHTATLLNNGTVLMAGGQGTNSPSPLASAELYVLVAVSPAGLSFSNQTVGIASAPQTAVLTNNQSTALTVTAIVVSGTNASDFSETDNCVGSVPVAASCSINVTFTPGALGTRTGSLNIASNVVSGGASLTVPLTGTGAAAPQVSVTPSTITFPAQYVGTSGLPQSVTVMNNGSTPLNITGVTTSATDFGMLNACGSTVAAGSTCAIGVFFDPTASGTRTGTLTITDNAGNSPQTVTLTGSGQDFSVTPGSASSATVSPGQTANYSIAVAPAGGFAQSVALSCNGGPAQSTCSVTPNMISLSGTAAKTAMVTVTTAAQGSLLPFGTDRPAGMKYRTMPLLLVWMALLLVMVAASLLRRRKLGLPWVPVLALVVLVCVGLTLTSCGGGSGGGGGGTGTPAGTYTVTVTGNFSSGSTSLTHTANLTLVVQ
jgi:hypothetical protein